MAKIFTFSIVCFTFLAARAQHSPSLLTAEALENNTQFAHHLTTPHYDHRWAIYEDTIDVWKRWEVVDNYSFGLDRGRITMIGDLQSLHPYFRDKVLELMRVCKGKGIELAIVETYRTPLKQREYKSRGRRFTRAGPGQSKHQYGLAVDIVPIKDGKPQWGNTSLWRKVGATGEKLGLTWGGRWRRLFDPAHFEWTGGLGIHSLAQGIFPTLPQSAKYPCLEEDLKELQRHWKAWQLEQSETARKEAAARTRVKAISKLSSLAGGE